MSGGGKRKMKKERNKETKTIEERYTRKHPYKREKRREKEREKELDREKEKRKQRCPCQDLIRPKFTIVAREARSRGFFERALQMNPTHATVT